jgi:NAD(P)-dependent dehydrogenase (short-subunit alcohol dehydrogenase family)
MARRLVLITGASRGFGRSLALEAAKAWGELDMVRTYTRMGG